MKTLLKTSVLLFGLLVLISCKERDQQEPETKTVESNSISTETKTPTSALDHYMVIKNALVRSDLKATQTAAKSMMSINSNEDIAATLTAIATTDDIANQRSYFSKLTQVMDESVEINESAGKVYKQFCPMAFNNTGGYWLSTEKEIRNPYYGDQMLKCGRVVEEFN
jgi:hypothetical protein